MAGEYGSGTYNTGVYNPVSTSPTSVIDAETTGLPVLAAASATTPTSLVDPETVGQTVTSDTTVYGNSLYGAGIYNPLVGVVTPASLVDPTPIGNPTAGTAVVTPTGYGSGVYGNGTYTGGGARGPASTADGETLGQPALSGTAVQVGTGYSGGLYGTGEYPGSLANPGGAATPLNPPIVQIYPPALHILGIGPWNPVKAWRGAANYGIGKGVMPARPQMQLPGVISKSVTLRLTGGCEASATVQLPRGSAIVIEEMATDLWWRRRDPRTGKLEMLGRFNTSHNDLTRGDAGTMDSALQFQDYTIILGARMILKYLNTYYETDGKTIKDQQSEWKAGTSVTSILKWAMPTNTGIDYTALDDTDLLGVLKAPYSLPPYNTIADTIAQLQNLSSKTWEWWVETPVDLSQPPQLSFAIGQRGRDRGVTLFDLGTGPTPIASWSMRATSDTYANAMYFQGGSTNSTSGGGVIRTIPAAITEYGQRDTQVSDNTITGTLASYYAAADKALTAVADRRPTFTVVLKDGFWRGRSHIDVGDTVRLRIRLGQEVLAHEYRVTEIQVDIDGIGAETVTLTLGKPLASKNPRSRFSPIFKLLRTLRNYAPSDRVNTETGSTNPTT